MTVKPNIAIIILAAGGSSRMGQPKQLLPWGKTTLLGHSIDQALNSQAKKVFVVLGANVDEIGASIEHKSIQLLKNKGWESGMGCSIAVGAKKALEEGFDAVLIMLADQPQIDSVFLGELISEWQKKQQPIIATGYDTKAGVPAIFEKSYFSELAALEGDLGAKEIIATNISNVVVLSHSNVIDDIDTLETYNKIVNEYLEHHRKPDDQNKSNFILE